MPPDPAGVADLWERLLVRLESIGAAVEPERPGLACFDARGLLRLHGGVDGVLAAARTALRVPARFGVAPSRFAAVAAATRARVRAARRCVRASVRASVRRRPARAARGPTWRRCRSRCCAPGRRWPSCPRRSSGSGSPRWGSWRRCAARRSPIASARSGLLAHELAGGGDTPLRAAAAASCCASRSTCPRPPPGCSSSAGWDCSIDRLLARRERRGRTLRAVVDLRGAGRAGRHLARAGGVPRGARRSGADAPGADARIWR